MERPWDARCPDHAGEASPGPCVDCGAVRREAERLRREEAGRAQAEKQARRDAISNCSFCDWRGMYGAHYPDGKPFMIRCPHDLSALDEAVAEAIQARFRPVEERRPAGGADKFAPILMERLEKARRARLASEAMARFDGVDAPLDPSEARGGQGSPESVADGR